MEPSSGSLRFKISLSKQEMEHEEPETSSKDTSYKTSYSLYIVLSEIHQLCVKRDHKGIFAHPVTEDIAPDYFSFISNPMDLGTIYARLSSRNFYSTAEQYLDDLRLMCQNAMLYNPPETIYYQKARKMLAFAEKQISPQGLRKLSADLLKTSRPLTDEEMGISPPGTPRQHHHGGHHGHHSHRQHREESQSGPSSRNPVASMPLPKLKEEIPDVEAYSTRSVEREELDSTPSSSDRKRRLSNASMSSVSATKVARYANSPPHLLPEVDESFGGRTDSPRTQSTCGRSDAITIDQETAEADQVDYFVGASPGSSSTISSSANRSSRRPARNVTNRRSTSTTKRVAPNSSRQSKSPRRVVAAAAAEQRTYAEDAWTFTNIMTDRTPPAQVLAQVKRAAQNAQAKYLEKYGQPGRQTVVYLDTSETGKIYAVPCRGSDRVDTGISSSPPDGLEEGGCGGGGRKLVNYPLAMRQLLTPKTQSTGSVGYHGLIEQMTSQQVATLHALSKLRYDPTEPIAMGIHGPLAIFEKDELAQLIDTYGGASDLTVVESVLSLLKFVEPIGLEARRIAHLRLADATDGYHARMLISFADPESPFHVSNWMKRAKLTIDSSIVEEFKTKLMEESVEKIATDETSLISTESPTTTIASSVLNEESVCGGGQMSIAKLPSNTSTTSTTDKQLAAFQLQPNSAEEGEEAVGTDLNEQINEEGVKDEEEVERVEESFDILTEALNAAIVTPTDRNQPILPDAATVNELAQISALTAAISPMQQNIVPLPTTSPIQHSPGVPTSTVIPHNMPMIVSAGPSISTPLPLSAIRQSGKPNLIPVLTSGTQIYPPGVPTSSLPPLQIESTSMCQSDLAQSVEPNSLQVQEGTGPPNILMPVSLESDAAQEMSIVNTVPFQEGENLSMVEKATEPEHIPKPIDLCRPEDVEMDVEASSKSSTSNPNVSDTNSPLVDVFDPQNSLEESVKTSVQECLETFCTPDQADDDYKEISILSESQEVSTHPNQQPLPTNSIQSSFLEPVSVTTAFQGNQYVQEVESSIGPQSIALSEHLQLPFTQVSQSELLSKTNIAKESIELGLSPRNLTPISETTVPPIQSDGYTLCKDAETIPKNVDQKSVETSLLQTQSVTEDKVENSPREYTSENALGDSEDNPSTEIGSLEPQQKELAALDGSESQSKCCRMHFGDVQQEGFSDLVPVKPTAGKESSSSKMDSDEVAPTNSGHGTDQDYISKPTLPPIYAQNVSGDVELHSDLSSGSKLPLRILLSKDIIEPGSIEHLAEIQESTEATSHLMDVDLDSNPNLSELKISSTGKYEEIAVSESSTNDPGLEKPVEAFNGLSNSNDLIPVVSFTVPPTATKNPSEIYNEPSEHDTNPDLQDPIDSNNRDDNQELIEVVKGSCITSEVVSDEPQVEPSITSSDSSPMNTVVESVSTSIIKETVTVQRDIVQETTIGEVKTETLEPQVEESVSRPCDESGPSSKLQEPVAVPEIDTTPVEPPKCSDIPSEILPTISAQNEPYPVPGTHDPESLLVSSEESQSKDQSEVSTIHSPDVITENPSANGQFSVKSTLEEQSSVQSSIPPILPCDNASIQPDSILPIPMSSEVSNSPASVEPFNPQQANVDEDAQTGYPHSDISMESRGGGLVDYECTDSSASGSANPP